jgi:hypothetical protein
MSKYVPHLRELLPTCPFLSAMYGATEGIFGMQSELVEFYEAHRGAGTASSVAASSNAALVAPSPGAAPPATPAASDLANDLAALKLEGQRAGSVAPPSGTHSEGRANEGCATYAAFQKEQDGCKSYLLFPNGGGRHCWVTSAADMLNLLYVVMPSQPICHSIIILC